MATENQQDVAPATERLDLFPAWRQAIEDAHQEFTWGDTIPNEWLISRFRLEEPKTIEEFKRYQFDVLRAMDQFRDGLLTKYKMALKTRRGTGYEIVRPAAQTDHGMDELKRDISRALGKCHRILTNISDRMLDLDEAKHNAEQRAKLAALAAFSRKAIDPKPAAIEDQSGDVDA